MKKESNKTSRDGWMKMKYWFINRVREIAYPNPVGMKVIGPKMTPVDENGMMAPGFTILMSSKQLGYYGVHHVVLEELETVEKAKVVAERIANRLHDIKKGNTVDIRD